MKKTDYYSRKAYFLIKRCKLAFLPLVISLLIILASIFQPQMQEKQSINSNRHIIHNAFAPNATTDYTQFVNPFIGTAHGSHGDSGDTFPGAVYPMGMVQWSPDTITIQPGGYYYPDSTIKDFSLTHFSGRGCNVYQNFPFIPHNGTVTSSPGTNLSDYYQQFSHSNEIAHPGYYSVKLNSGIQVELTTTARTGFGQFSFPSSTNSTLIIDAGDSAKGNTSNTGVNIITNNQVTGRATSMVGCGNENYTVYFSAQFDEPFKSFGTWNGGTVNDGSRSSSGAQSGAFVTFDTTANQTVHVRVGISFVNTTNAQDNVSSENSNSDFQTIKNNASAAWNSKLSKIEIQGGTTDNETVFYTALYHTFIHPNIFSDSNGQYMGFDNQVHLANGYVQYENFPGWDMYRSFIALRAFLTPSDVKDMISSLIADAKQGGGGFPRWEQANQNSGGMIGDSPDAVVATSYALGVRNFDTQTALNIMDSGASSPGTKSGSHSVREGLSDYLSLGYVTPNTSGGSAAITLEYALDDFALAQFANALGDSAKFNTYLSRSKNWTHLFNSNSKYIQPKDSSGNFLPNFSPTSETEFREGDSAQYTWMIPYDLQSLFTKMGGNQNVIQRLDNLFTKLNDGPTSQYAYMGNEPDFFNPWEYDFVGMPSSTEGVNRRIQEQLFSNTSGGLPGNDDGGAMSAWYLWSEIGLYPEIPGVGGFAIGSPFFPQATIHLENGADIQITGNNATDNNPYIQSLTVNGQSYNNPWLSFASIQNGGALTFSLVNSPTNWGSTINLSPSPIPPVSGTTSPTETVTTSPGVTENPSITESVSPTSEVTLPPTPTPGPNDTVVGVSLLFPGIDANENIHPLKPLRIMTITMYNVVTGQKISKQDKLIFNGDDFINPSVDFGIIPDGSYQIFVKTDGYLQLRLAQNDGTNTFTITSGTTINLPTNSMIGGDIAPQRTDGTYGDNTLDISDYNLLLNCYKNKANTISCSNKSAADLDNNGSVDGIDYNIFLRGISQATNGDIIPN